MQFARRREFVPPDDLAVPALQRWWEEMCAAEQVPPHCPNSSPLPSRPVLTSSPTTTTAVHLLATEQSFETSLHNTLKNMKQATAFTMKSP